MVQIRLNASEQPEQAVYSQHKSAESHAWKDTPKAGDTPLVYVARGSHANYFSAGSHWTGTWFDQADGKGPQIAPTLEVLTDTAPAWLLWPGSWGDTKPGILPIDSSSPISPGRRNHWLDPSQARRRDPEGRAAAARAAAGQRPPRRHRQEHRRRLHRRTRRHRARGGAAPEGLRRTRDHQGLRD